MFAGDRESLLTAQNAEEAAFFVDEICQTAEIAIYEVGIMVKREIRPDSPYCFNVSSKMQARLNPENRMEMEIGQIRIGSEVIEHCFLWKRNFLGKTWIADATYKQFVPEGQRESLPDVMIAGFNNDHELEAILCRYLIPKEYHPFWLNLFPE